MTDVLRELSKLSVGATPEQRKVLVAKLASMPVALEEAYREALAAMANQDSPEGFLSFYELIHGFPPPKHVEKWIRSIFKAHGEGKGYTLNGWRGSWKSVSVSVTFQAWRIGIEPTKTNVTISANDDSAEKITKLIANIIELHPEWKRAFPNIVPESGRWTVEGFYVLDTGVSREEWAKIQAGTIDPTFVGGGWTSTRINGKHPTGVMVVDDIHDLNNSSSERERKQVVKAMTTVILKTVIRKNDKLDTWFLNVGVPWAEDDSHHILKNSGGFLWDETPAMTRSVEGRGVYIDGVNKATGVLYEDVRGWWELTEPKRFGVNSIMAERALGKAEFWQMIMLDLVTASSGKLKYQLYPRDELRTDWPMGGGADPTNVDKPRGEAGRRSSFALAYGVKVPTGGGVVVDGVLEPCSLQQAVGHMKTAQTRFSNWQGVAAENVGGGAVFCQAVPLIDPTIKIFGSNLTDEKGRVKSKADRFLEVSTWLENGRWRISDNPTPFNLALRKLCDNFYDLIGDLHNECWDAGDAFYHLVKSMPDLLATPTYDRVAQREKKHSPLEGMRDYRGYSHG